MEKITLPNYLTLKHYKALDKVYSLESNLQTIYTIASVLDIDVEEVKKWDLDSIKKVWKGITDVITESGNIEFYPIIEFEGVQYGFTPMSKMSVGEYIDIDNLAKDKLNNIEQILSILYRPIKSHTIRDLKFRIKSSIKLIFTRDKVEHLFDYYEVEEYNSNKRKKQAELFNDFPVSIGLGALAFFLGVGNLSLIDSQISTLPKPLRKERMRNEILQYKNIMGGYTRYTSWEKLPSFKSGERITFSL